MLDVVDAYTVSFQLLHNPERPSDRPEDVSYGSLRLRPGQPLPVVGDFLFIDGDEDEPMGAPVVVLSRLFGYISIKDTPQSAPAPAILNVNLVCRRATDLEMARAIKE